MDKSWKPVLLFGFALLVAAPAHAQDDAALRGALLGQEVTVDIDMPATEEGIDFYPERSPRIDFDKYADRIAKYGTAGNPGLVAVGISEALITTAYGLMVGIPTLAAYFYFKRKVDMRVLEMEEVAVNLMQDLAQWRGQTPAQPLRSTKQARPSVAGSDMAPSPEVVD